MELQLQLQEWPQLLLRFKLELGPGLGLNLALDLALDLRGIMDHSPKTVQCPDSSVAPTAQTPTTKV